MQWHESDDEFFINVVASQQIHNVIMVVLERLRELPSKTFQVQTAVQRYISGYVWKRLLLQGIYTVYLFKRLF